jgi:hypothetical protein
MNTFHFSAIAIALAGAFATQGASAATTTAATTFVSAGGLDSNTATGCSASAPCRTFAAALPVTSSGGEVVAVDSADFGPVSITQSVSIIAPDGVFAGIKVAGGNAVSVSGSGLQITLRGLTIYGPGPASSARSVIGVYASGANNVLVQHCNFGGFYPSNGMTGADAGTGAAIFLSGAAGKLQARVIDNVIHNSVTGIGISGAANVEISHVRLANISTIGVGISDAGYGEADVAVSDTEWSQASLSSGGYAFYVNAGTAGSQLYLDRATVTGGAYGVYAAGNSGFAYVTVTNSLFSKVSTALVTTQATGGAEITLANSTINASVAGASNSGGGTLVSAGNNLFVGNGSTVVGTMSRAALQ